MYKHIQETHDGIYNHTDIGADWKVTLCNRYRKPLERQIGEFIGIRRAKVLGQGKVGNKLIEVDKEVFNTKEEWFSHTSQWDAVGYHS